MSAAEAIAGNINNLSGDVSAACMATTSTPAIDIVPSPETLSISTAKDDPNPVLSEPAEEANAPAAIRGGTSVSLVSLWLCVACGG